MDLSKFKSAGKSYVDKCGNVILVRPDGTEKIVTTIEVKKEISVGNANESSVGESPSTDQIGKESRPFGFRK